MEKSRANALNHAEIDYALQRYLDKDPCNPFRKFFKSEFPITFGEFIDYEQNCWDWDLEKEERLYYRSQKKQMREINSVQYKSNFISEDYNRQQWGLLVILMRLPLSFEVKLRDDNKSYLISYLPDNTSFSGTWYCESSVARVCKYFFYENKKPLLEWAQSKPDGKLLTLKHQIR